MATMVMVVGVVLLVLMICHGDGNHTAAAAAGNVMVVMADRLRGKNPHLN